MLKVIGALLLFWSKSILSYEHVVTLYWSEREKTQKTQQSRKEKKMENRNEEPTEALQAHFYHEVHFYVPNILDKILAFFYHKITTEHWGESKIILLPLFECMLPFFI